MFVYVCIKRTDTHFCRSSLKWKQELGLWIIHFFISRITRKNTLFWECFFLLFKTQNTPATLFSILMPSLTYCFQIINDNVLSTQLTTIIDHGCKSVFGSANVTVQSSAWSSLGCSTQVLFWQWRVTNGGLNHYMKPPGISGSEKWWKLFLIERGYFTLTL